MTWCVISLPCSIMAGTMESPESMTDLTRLPNSASSDSPFLSAGWNTPLLSFFPLPSPFPPSLLPYSHCSSFPPTTHTQQRIQSTELSELSAPSPSKPGTPPPPRPSMTQEAPQSPLTLLEQQREQRQDPGQWRFSSILTLNLQRALSLEEVSDQSKPLHRTIYAYRANSKCAHRTSSMCRHREACVHRARSEVSGYFPVYTCRKIKS